MKLFPALEKAYTKETLSAVEAQAKADQQQAEQERIAADQSRLASALSSQNAKNARIKAEAFCKASGLPTVADDSGLCADALHGAPGVNSARYAGHHGDDAANNEKLLREMADVPAEKRGAKFVSAVCFMLPAGPVIRA